MSIEWERFVVSLDDARPSALIDLSMETVERAPVLERELSDRTAALKGKFSEYCRTVVAPMLMS